MVSEKIREITSLNTKSLGDFNILEVEILIKRKRVSLPGIESCQKVSLDTGVFCTLDGITGWVGRRVL